MKVRHYSGLWWLEHIRIQRLTYLEKKIQLLPNVFFTILESRVLPLYFFFGWVILNFLSYKDLTFYKHVLNLEKGNLSNTILFFTSKLESCCPLQNFMSTILNLYHFQSKITFISNSADVRKVSTIEERKIENFLKRQKIWKKILVY